MGIIKKNLITDRGTILLEKQEPIKQKVVPVTPVTNDLPKGPDPRKMQAEQAKTEAEKIIIQAQNRADQIAEAAKKQGREEGKAEAAANIKQSLETLNQAIKERKNIVKDSEAEILRLAIKVAEQIIRSEVSLHRDVCLNIVTEAIARVSDREQIIIKVNREDAEYLKRYKDRLTSVLDGVKSFSILEDATIEAGGCVIETTLGFIDAKISTKLKSIEEAFQKTTADDNSVQEEEPADQDDG
ncbi:MAG: FliH/SctL family protein [bacterium]